ncbi:hypothetical protein Cyast_1766 [Cyanobacterium stanieri PCC 7202]|uniref:Uncharacterized protein n=1 Tax=Cyanobacterium stanieri (strain ATCC 29140 / PCC 7202) TaxID=292563 RepID=K9YMN9_CYASC|nr:hypothetical protein Cyast_1766 [Cyanobacterium stanieri PCC 7202]
MFSKGNKESKTDTNPNIGNFVPPSSTDTDIDIEKSSVPIPDNVMDKEQIQTVKLVEKISSILSPYFIVIVGLYLSDDSFLIGFVLIVIGILSLLKISLQDIVALIEKAKNSIGGKDS